MSDTEAGATFDCFGSSCTVHVTGDGRSGTAPSAVELAQRTLSDWHVRFSRFLLDSELSRLNGDPRETVPASPMMVLLAQAVHDAGAQTGGLVDATLLQEIRSAGYRRDLPESLALGDALALAPPRAPATPAPTARWRAVSADRDAGTVTRPAGVMLDSGGLAKGLFADVLAEMLADHASFAVNCGGDIAIGGCSGAPREVKVESPFDGRTLHSFAPARGAVATSGIGRRSWLDAEGRPAHHLLDPATGRPAFTGLVQVTALAPRALQAEIYAKAAILSGPRTAARWLPYGGVLVHEDGSHGVIQPPPVISLSELSAYAKRNGTSGREAA